MTEDIPKPFVKIYGHFEAEEKHEKPIQVIFLYLLQQSCKLILPEDE